jgi:hypothetical protein
VVAEDGKMAEMLNEFFSSVFTREDGDNVPEAERMETEELRGINITEWRIRKIIRKLRKDAAAGPDEIGPRLLQELEDGIVPGLTMIFRCSLETGDVPEDWKMANVTPIFKKGTKTDPGNYRPVSLTSVCCKVLETAIRDDLMRHLEQNRLVNPSQHGFMPGRSCCSNLLEFLERATAAVDEGLPYDVVFLDFAKAFDKVPKERLLEKLKAHGVRGEVLQWIRNWLTERKQRVVLNGKASSWARVLSGVPQGSVLGPILFLIFINDLDMEVKRLGIVRKFADDTKLGHGAGTDKERSEMQEALDALVAWAEKWGMQFNVAKCKVMHLGNNNIQQVYTMNGQQLGITKEEVDIGVAMIGTLKPSAQCRRAARTAQTVLGQLARGIHNRDRNIFLRLYQQYVRPHLEFASPAWSPWQEGDKECLEKVQRRAVGMIAGLKSRDYSERLKELGLTTLEERRHQLDMVQVYKIVNGVGGVKSEQWFKMSENVRETRRTDPTNIRIQAARLEVRRNFFSHRVPAAWNNVPAEIRQAKTAQAFKQAYKVHRRNMVAIS